MNTVCICHSSRVRVRQDTACAEVQTLKIRADLLGVFGVITTKRETPCNGQDADVYKQQSRDSRRLHRICEVYYSIVIELQGSCHNSVVQT